jgi:SWI/SNF-related matrix-associated actin-dependent regulator 1 of chromatin subfamily A
VIKRKPPISLTLHQGQAKVKPASFLSGNFRTYLDTCNAAGARYDPELKCQFVRIESIPLLVEKLKLAGFNPVLAPDLVQIIQAEAAAARSAIAAAEDRLRATDAELKGRGLALYGFQRSGVTWLAERSRALLADEMGLGKTIQALIALPNKAAAIVLCPASLKGNWANEAGKWRPDLWIHVLSGHGSWQWPRPGEIVILNYDILPGALDPSLCPLDIVLVADEAHAIKNTRAARSQRFREISNMILGRGGKIWMLTGTPLLNRPQELWSLLAGGDMAAIAFGSWTKFVKAFGGAKAPSGYGYDWGSPTAAVPDQLRRVMLYRKRAEVLPDLPVKTWRTIQADIDREAVQACDELVAHLASIGRDIRDTIEHDADFEQMAKARALLARAKIPRILELVKTYEDSEEPIVVFSAHREPVDVLAKREGWAAITGDTPAGERTSIVTEFQGGRLKGLAATIQAGGVGITLTRAHECLFVDLLWTPALNKQAEDRLCRIGQTRGVVITRIVADHALDQRVTEILDAKQALIEGTIEKAAVGAERQRSQAERMEQATMTLPDAIVSQEPGIVSEEPEIVSKHRKPISAFEEWAAAVLVAVADMDPDHAQDENGVGFNKLDNHIGHSLADQIRKSGNATNGQWMIIVRLAYRYKGQVKFDQPVLQS